MAISVFTRRVSRLEATINGVQPESMPADSRSALAARLERLHEYMSAAGMLHEVTSAEDVTSAQHARLDAIARHARQLGGTSA